MYCIQLIWKTGGSTTVTADSLESCKRDAKVVSERIGGSLAASTLPYEVEDASIPDVSIPTDFRPLLGDEFMRLYLQAE